MVAKSRKTPQNSKSPNQSAPAALPEGWEVARLGDLADVKYGKANPKSSGNVPVIGSGGIFAWTDKPLVEFPTIVVGRKGTAGEIHLSENPSYPSDTTFYLAWQKQVNVQFLFHFLSLHKPSGEHAKTTIPSLQRHVLENLVVVLPPESEQRAIARVLSAIQRAIETQDKLIAAARHVKKALMRHLFTYGTVPPADAARVPLKETEIGAVPEGWEVVKLGNIVESLDHRRIPLKSSDRAKRRGNIPYYGASGIIDWIDEYIFDEPVLLVSEDGANLESRTLPIAYIVDGKCWVNNHAHVLRPRNGNRAFIQNYVNNMDLSDYLSGTTRPKLNQAMLMEIRIPSPTVSEQRAIARILAVVDQKIATEEKRKAALQTLFKTMLHQLMTGQVRVRA